MDHKGIADTEQRMLLAYKTLRTAGLSKEDLLAIIGHAEAELPQIVYVAALYTKNETYKRFIDEARDPKKVAQWNTEAQECVRIGGDYTRIAVTFERQPRDDAAQTNFNGIPNLTDEGIYMLQLMLELQDAYDESGLDGHFRMGVKHLT